MNKYTYCQLFYVVCWRDKMSCSSSSNLISSITWQNPLKLKETTRCWFCCVKIRWKIWRNKSMLYHYFCVIPQDPSLWFDFSDRKLDASALQHFRVAFLSPKCCRALEGSDSFPLKYFQ